MAESSYIVELSDAFEWMADREPSSIHAIVTDPPYGLKEYTDIEKRKLRGGRGGVWRIPPAFDGCKRSPLPRFTVLDDAERVALRTFFERFAQRAMRILVPGGTFSSPPTRYSHIWYIRRLSKRALRSVARLLDLSRLFGVEIDQKMRT